MKLAVLGGSTRIDQHFLRHALHSGYSIHFLGTQVESVPRQPNLTVTHGSPQDTAIIEEVLSDAQAVISLPYAISDLETLSGVIQTMYAYSIARLIVAADLYQAEPQHFKAMLKQAGIDWTIIQFAPKSKEQAFALADTAVAKYIVKQITDVTNVRSALLLSN